MKLPKTLFVLGAIVTLGAISLFGCQKTAATQADATGTVAATEKTPIPPELEKYKDAIQKLPKNEWAAVYKQKTCPVSGGLLGAMGTPIKVKVDGRDVYICCAACKKPLEEDPKKYLDKLPE